jgi:dephospho-CoA kinase
MSRFSIALTGGVASGKSEVSRLFQRMGIFVADADVAAREIVAPGQPALREIVERFGSQILGPDGSLDRRRLREVIFSDSVAKRDLEAITHPRIRRQLQQCSADADGAYAVVVIPLLAESGGRSSYPWLDRILVVDAPVAIQLERLQRRDGIADVLARQMIAAQASRERRLALADDVIVNDGPEASLLVSVEKLDARYRRLAG